MVRPSVVSDPAVVENELAFCEKLAAGICPSCNDTIDRLDDCWYCESCKHQTAFSS